MVIWFRGVYIIIMGSGTSPIADPVRSAQTRCTRPASHTVPAFDIYPILQKRMEVFGLYDNLATGALTWVVWREGTAVKKKAIRYSRYRYQGSGS